MNIIKTTRHIVQMFTVLKTVAIKNNWIQMKISAPMIGLLPFVNKLHVPKNNQPSITDIITQADNLFENENYTEAYNLLKQHQDDRNIEIFWRISRVLYKLSKTEDCNQEINRAMLLEANQLISECLEINEENGNVHKWAAIILDAKFKLENKRFQIPNIIKLKDHLMKAHQLNPDDYAVLFMLGKWHYTMSNLSWFQRKLITLFDKQLPKCDYEQALQYFLRAEEIKPRYNLSNIYMLGITNYQIGNMYRAHYYLNIASQMTPHFEHEEKCVLLAQNLVEKLNKFQIKEDVV